MDSQSVAAPPPSPLATVDLVVCIFYLLSVIGVGLGASFFTGGGREREKEEKKYRAVALEEDGGDEREETEKGKTMEEYFLGGRSLPWWALGIADVSSYIDISGTMINTALVYAMGAAGMYIEIRGGMCLMLALQLAFTGKLVRRSEVMTKGEWLKFRFGDGRQGRLARMTLSLLIITGCVLAITYFVEGGGKLMEQFFSVPSYLHIPSRVWIGLFLMLISLSYTVIAGFRSLVYTDVYQSIFVFGSFLYVIFIGMSVRLPDTFNVFMPVKSEAQEDLVYSPNLLPGAHVHEAFRPVNTSLAEWTSLLPKMHLQVPSDVSYEIYNAYGLAISFYLLRTTISAAGGPGGGGLQTVLAQKTERDVGLQTFTAILLLSLRWAFTAAIAVLAVDLTVRNAGLVLDPEKAIPAVIGHVLPSGGRGLVLASLLAAAMTTFDSGLHSTSSYWTVDVYQTFLRPQATEKELLWQARIASAVLMVLGLLCSLLVSSVNQIWGFMTMAFGASTCWVSFLSWYWWRFTGYGYVAGIVAGILGATLKVIFFPDSTEYFEFLFVSFFSLSASLMVTFATDPPELSVLEDFYRKTRPPGWWNAISQYSLREEHRVQIRRENRLDLLSAANALAWQTALFALMMAIVFQSWSQAFWLSCLVGVLSYLLYVLWYSRTEQHWSPT